MRQSAGWFSLRYGLPALAVAALGFSVIAVVQGHPVRTMMGPPIPPPMSPFTTRIGGVGIVEPKSETIAIATELGGVVRRTYVTDGERVRAGQPLFALDDRDYRAGLADAEARLAAQAAALSTIQRQTESQQAVAAQQQAYLDGARAERKLAQATEERDAVLAHEQLISRQVFDSATAENLKAQAGLSASIAGLAAARLQREVLIAQTNEARAKLAAERAARDRAAIALERCVVRAPIDATVLRVNIHAGEYAQPGVLAAPLMMLGAIDELHLRVEVDEADAWRVNAGAEAIGLARGNPSIRTRLKFIRLEPVVVPKHNLTGVDDRVDTRVLEAIYAFDPATFPARVGQEVDVFIAAPSALPAQPQVLGNHEPLQP